jgi:hypothetical protein
MRENRPYGSVGGWGLITPRLPNHWKTPPLKRREALGDNFRLPPEFLRYPQVFGGACAKLSGLAKGGREVPGML